MEKKKAREEIKLALASKGNMFGQEDVVNKRLYTTTVRCVSNEAHVYVINNKEFFYRFGKDEKTWKAILSLSLEKDSHTKKKIILA